MLCHCKLTHVNYSRIHNGGLGGAVHKVFSITYLSGFSSSCMVVSTSQLSAERWSISEISPAIPLLPHSPILLPLPLLYSFCSFRSASWSICCLAFMTGDWKQSYLVSPQESTSLHPDNSAPLGPSLSTRPSTTCCVLHQSIFLHSHLSALQILTLAAAG